MSDNLRGIIAILASSTGFLLNDATMKFVLQTMPPGQALFLRGVLSSILLYGVTRWFNQSLPHRAMFERGIFLRSLAAAGSALFIVLSLQRLPLATVNAVIQITPLAVVAGAGVFFGERIGWQRWCAALLGFCGVMLVLKPVGSVDSAAPVATTLALTALAFTATRDLLTRSIGKSTPPLFIAYATSLLVMTMAFGLGFSESWIVPDLWTSLRVMITAVCITFAYAFGVIAMRTGELSVVAPFRYFQIPSAVVLGYLIWDHIPDRVSFLGIALVLIAGLSVVLRERHQRRQVVKGTGQT